MINLKARTGVCALISLIAGCQTAPPQKQALDTDAISAVQMEIKRQIGLYLRQSHRSNLGIAKEEFACGNGSIDFDISNVKAQLTTTLDATQDVGAKLAIPWGGVTIGPSAERKKTTSNTQALVYNLWLLEPGLQDASILNAVVPQKDIDEASIAKVLLSLREALIRGAKKSSKSSTASTPCFTDYNPDKPLADAGNTFTLGLSFVTTNTGGIEIKVGIVDFTATTEWKSTTGNTLTVAFIQRGLASLQRLKDTVDAECKYPKTEKDTGCRDALTAFKKEQTNPGVGVATPQ